jgi:translation initiation factor IF-2
MSDIAVKKLAEMINAPVEVLLKQLQEAGIPVSGPDASITDAQKLALLAHIRQGGNNNANNNANKITLTKRSTSEMTVGNPQGRGKTTVSVEVRRKKSFTPPTGGQAQSQNSSHANRAEEMAKQMDAQRRTREEAIAKAEQERRQLEARRIEQQRQKGAVVRPAGNVSKVADVKEADAISEISHDLAPTVEDAVGKVQAAKPAPVEATVKESTTAVPKNEPIVVSKETMPAKPVVESKPTPVVKEQVTNTPASSSTPAPKVVPVVASEPIAPEAEREPLSAREQREVVAAAAKEAAAAALKRRPSKLKIPPKLVAPPAPEPVVVVEKPEPAPEVAVTPEKAPVVAKPAKTAGRNVDEEFDASERIVEKKLTKKPAKGGKSGGDREEMHAPGGNKNFKKKGGKQPSRPDPRNAVTAKHAFEKPTAPVIKEVEIPANIVVSDLAQKLAIRATDIIKAMMKMGMMVTINQTIDQDTAILVTEELGHKAKPMQEIDDATLLASIMGQEEYAIEPRPPVVTIMGHVDHGKTSLLDYIRKTRVAAGEAGGITQHIGAYHVDTDHGTVTFLDTPGHAAFTKMRARGAQVTDIVILIVAADDGVMPQTKEAIQHAKAAGVPMVVAINKIDKPAADPDRVLSELSQNGVNTEAWGGDVPVVQVSAKTGQGIDELLETLLLVAEVQELTAPVEAPAQGNVIEASIEKGRGAVATILVRSGTLNRGDLILCGAEYGRVRAMFDENGRPVKEAGPSIPVAVVGLSAAPEAGDEVVVLNDERKAKEIAELRREKVRDNRFAAQSSAKLDNIFSQMQAGARAQVNLLVKADVQGSVEAIRSELLKLSTDEVEVRIVAAGVGGINGGDVDLAAAAKAVIVAFNVRADATARKTASDNNVEIRYYSIIYDVVNDVKEAMSGLLSPEVREVFVGLAEVRNVFRSSGFGQVAGCLVIDGTVRRGLPIRVLRNNVVIYQGELESLRRHRDDVKEVHMGTECGIAVKDYNDVQVGDQIECYDRVEVARKI